jgi:hypothetical protein
MNINIDNKEYMKRHDALLERIARAVRLRLGDAGLWEDQDVVEGVVYDICALLDGIVVEDSGDQPLRPIIMFADDEDGEQLVGVQGGSYMHEICHDIVEKIYGKKSSA